ncbi:MAG: RNA polymerase sigma factor [Verrucomicrobiales bacterium]
MPASHDHHPALAEFAESADERAFVRVVDEFSGLVFTSANRRTGDRELAREVTQNVFAIAARKAARLARHPSLTAWFYTTTRLESAKALRTRQRHQRRVEALSKEMTSQAHPMTAEEQENWRDVLPALDDSLDRLRPAEREILLGRYFEGRSFKEIAAGCGKSEAACKMSLKRTLTKLRGWLSGRGATLSATALAAGLTAEFSKAAPASLAASLPAGAIAAAPGLGSATILTNTLNTMSTIKSTSLAAVAVLALGVIPVAMQQSQAKHVKAELATLRDQAARAGAGRPIHEHRGAGDGAALAAGEVRPVASFLAAMRRPLDADELIEQIASASMSRDMSRIMRVLLPLAKLSPGEGQQLLADVQASGKSQQMKDMAMQMLSMMVHQPEDSPGEALDQHLSHGVHSRNIASQLRDWAKRDPSSAIAWFESRRGSELLAGKGVDNSPQRHLLVGLVGGVAHSDPDRAIALLDGAGDDVRHEAISDLAAILSMDQATQELALTLVLSIESPADRARAAGEAASSLVRRGRLDEAAAFVHAAELDDDRIAATIGSSAMARGGDESQSFSQRVSWAMQNSPEGSRPSLVRELARDGYHYHSPDEISAWVDSLPEGGERDAGLAAESGALYMNDRSVLALQRAQAISDPILRADTVKRLFVWVNHRSSAAAEKLAVDHGIQLGDILGTKQRTKPPTGTQR